jgi:hypothetical protein
MFISIVGSRRIFPALKKLGLLPAVEIEAGAV